MRHEHVHTAGHRLWCAAALTTLLMGVASTLVRTHRRRLDARSPAKPEALQTWEGEGGGLPDGGPHTQVQPRATPDPDDSPTKGAAAT